MFRPALRCAQHPKAGRNTQQWEQSYIRFLGITILNKAFTKKILSEEVNKEYREGNFLF